ncbi:MAG: ATP-binding protein [Candidatus Xenobiia bacterium LiM19]
MCDELIVAPHAPALIESMRSVGYTLESAIADLIDNSISAGARKISIRYSPFDNPYVAVLDDGLGMGDEELTEAMRHGRPDLWNVRAANDLGRFGLGLKTASLSQCRRLTVISIKEDIISARCWDLDLIAERQNWILKIPSSEEIEEFPLIGELKGNGHGTVVLWQHLDRIGAGEISIDRALREKMDVVREHLSLVFHRYLSGEQGIEKLEIRLNENPVQSFDPFLPWHHATQPLQEEQISVEGHAVLIKPFILPHISKLTRQEMSQAGGEEGLRRNQGFYIYRNRRLIIWGTWFRLTKQEELSKLARVRVDIPNALDHLWTLDIKKSVAHPPEEVRQNLRRIVEKIVGTSRRVYTYRGRRTGNNRLIHTWNRVEGREGVCYLVNREHPVVSALLNRVDDDEKRMLELLLETVERTFPADSLYADMASEQPRYFEEEDLREKFLEIARCLLMAASTIEGGRERLLGSLMTLEPFCYHPEIAESIIKECSNVT